ncbi:MAG: hypothetical protein PWQ67_2146 [Clostridia bacterium]|jgi:hypothetical protein|nr:hypothetical protein [Clostridia bacterium]
MKKIQLEIYVPLFKNPFILKGLAIAIGIPFGTLITVIIILTKGDIMGTDAKYALFLIGVLFVLTYITVMVVYGGKYAPGFIIDENGITNYTQESQTKKNKIINTILIIFGLYGGNLTAAGTGLIAQSRQVRRISWKAIRKVKYYPKQHTIIIRGALTEKIAIFCSKENYAQVEAVIKEKVQHKSE